MFTRRLLACGVAIAAFAAMSPSAPEATATSAPILDHVFVIVMENHSFGEIIGSSSAPYINSLLSKGSLATNYYAVAHPSLPNYLALTAGSTLGVTTDCTTCWQSAANIGDALESAGQTWKGYMESMPSACYVGSSYPYAQKHDPFIYFNDIRNNASRCASHVVPYSQLGVDLRSTSTTPNFGFITPNLCDDMHDCSVGTGDTWLSHQVPAILGSPAFTTQHSLLAITWDESDSSTSNRVPLILLGSVSAAYRSATAYNHYSLLHTVEAALGAGTLTSNDANAAIMGEFITAPAPCVVTVAAPVSPTSTEFAIQASSSGCAVASYDFEQLDTTLNQGWFPITTPADGFPGHGYQFRARARTTSGFVSTWSAAASITVSSTATLAHPFTGMYTLDAYGGMSPDSSPPLGGSAYWPGWPIARSAHALPGSVDSGLVLDGYGGLHSYGAGLTLSGAPFWGWDIARDFAFLPDGSGGYVLDGYGGLHPFAIGANAAPPAASGAPYWSGWQIARTVVLIPGSDEGYVLDGYGGVHGFNGAPAVSGAPYWGWDIARSMWLLPGSTSSAPAGYTLDGYGGLHPFGGAPAVHGAYWPGRDVARTACGA